MVSANLILNVLAACAAAVVAAPLDDPSGSVLLARAETSVLMCEDKGFKGLCRTERIQTGSCRNVPGELMDRISSIRNNDKNANTCTWYRERFLIDNVSVMDSDRECRGDSYRNQDDGNLGDGNAHFNDAIRSYECRRK
ncbi:hypothetical protein ColTof4_03127 [Colletotrichum tofieldiae]|uniref:Uncharacterized protein n=1 Tax=Colletotrichum tofieldiae TaxID=708197 RepID=A0A166W3H4_9PEZI|nr:hypothetical protein CT0861_11904 [Colletotrichum tofieldiae]GKT70704.1 hypothetical protein ColTof4_03127 [Colletotrichum tofieldiae]GKT94401.1 hypothetical protein Ct61P_12251 [Colletotrichum tofieldiae]